MKRSNVTIGNTTYDHKTGLPITVKKQPSAAPSVATPAKKSHAIHHGRLKKSNTLHRAYVKKPSANAPAQPTSPSQANVVKKATTAHRTNTVSVSTPSLTKKATPSTKVAGRTTIDGIRKKRATPAVLKPAHSQKSTLPRAKAAAAPIASPAKTISAIRPAKAAQPTAAAQQQRQYTPSSVLRKEAEHKALSEAPSHNKRHRVKPQKKTISKRKKVTRFATAGVAAAMLFGYFGYVNMPNISVRVAAAQAGINASFPGYQPNGYSLSGPVAFDKGSVRVQFALNGSDRGFTITQSKTNWDSIAALDNYVIPKSNNNYATTQENGLTIYSFNGNAAWVNKGILYTITGDAPLSNQQIESIATSM